MDSFSPLNAGWDGAAAFPTAYNAAGWIVLLPDWFVEICCG
jgi:hypothetical protein